MRVRNSAPRPVSAVRWGLSKTRTFVTLGIMSTPSRMAASTESKLMMQCQLGTIRLQHQRVAIITVGFGERAVDGDRLAAVFER
jgi:hypothetical protein